MTHLAHDLRLVCRSVIRAPGLALLVVVTLGLAVGANAAIYSLIDRVALRPLSVEKPHELVMVGAPPLPHSGPGFMFGAGGPDSVSYPLYVALRQGLRDHFASMALRRPARVTVAAEPAAVQVFGEYVSGEYFLTLGLRTVHGRAFSRVEEEQADGPPVVVLNHAFWTQHFGGDPGMVGRVIRVNDTPVTVVGVLAPGYTGTSVRRRPDLFLPLGLIDRLSPLRLQQGEIMAWNAPTLAAYTIVGRLKPGTRREAVEQQAQVYYRRLLDEAMAAGARTTPADREYYATHTASVAAAGTVGSEQGPATRSLERSLRLLLAMAAMVLAIASGNIANLLAARGATRSGEVALRFALGARSWHIVRPRLLECGLLAVGAALSGFVFAHWIGQLVPVVVDLGERVPGATTLPDRRVILFTLSVSLATGLCIWAASAFAVTRRSALPGLFSRTASADRRLSGVAVRRVFVVVQIALSVVLICAAALLSRSLVNILRVDPGFDAGAITALTLEPGAVGYRAERLQQYIDEAIRRVRALPGVEAATPTSQIPLAGGSSATWVSGPRQAAGRSAPPLTEVVQVGPEYFATIGLPLQAGRPFSGRDVEGAPRVAVVNETLARALVEGPDPLGQWIGFDGRERALQIVGVARDGRGRSLKAHVAPTLYLPIAQQPVSGSVHVLIRAAHGRPVDTAAFRTALRQIDARVAMTELSPLSTIVNDTLFRERMLAALSLSFAALAIVLAAMGLFGLTSFGVMRRTREFGIRVALGATAVSIMRMVLTEVSWLGGAGAIAGVAVFLAASRFLRSLLFDLSPTDPATVGVACLVACVVVGLAGLIPARRASRLDPAATLRAE